MNTPASLLWHRLPAVLGLLLAWLVFTNHCALVLIAGESAASAMEQCCHARSDNADDSAPASDPTCCKAVKVSLNAKLELSATTFIALPEPVAAAPAELVLTPLASAESTAARAPPRASTFSELVLARSLRSHAPPFAA